MKLTVLCDDTAASTVAINAEGFTFHGGHCTGGDAIACFRKAFGDAAVKPLGAGRVLRFPPLRDGDPVRVATGTP